MLLILHSNKCIACTNIRSRTYRRSTSMWTTTIRTYNNSALYVSSSCRLVWILSCSTRPPVTLLTTVLYLVLSNTASYRYGKPTRVTPFTAFTHLLFCHSLLSWFLSTPTLGLLSRFPYRFLFSANVVSALFSASAMAQYSNTDPQVTRKHIMPLNYSVLEVNHCRSCRLHALVARDLVSEWVSDSDNIL